MSDALRGKVAFYLPSLAGGGAERVMVALANSMAARGWAVELVLAQATGPYLGEVDPSVRLVDLNAGRVLNSLGRFTRYLRQQAPTVVISTMAHANIIAIWANRLAGRNTRLVIREAAHPSALLGQEKHLVRHLMRFLVRRYYRQADCIVAPSHGVARDLSRIAGLREEQIRVIFNPIDRVDLARRAAQPIEHPWLISGAPPVLIAVGRLSEEKGFSTLIRAFAQVRSRRVIRLMILGDGNQRSALEALAQSLGVAHDVYLPGFVLNPFPYMRLGAAFVLSSHFEGMPNSLAQAVALGCPVVATDCPSGPREILQDVASAKLVPVADPDAMAGAILQALDEPRCAPSEAFIARFDAAAVTEQYRQLVEELHQQPCKSHLF